MQSLQHTLFTDVADFYGKLLASLQQAEESIHLIYFAFDSGEWADKIGDLLQEKASSGVAVHLMVDEIGMAVDNLRNAYRNRVLLSRLQAGGVQVDLFRPAGRRLSQFNRLHVKVCAVDQGTVLMGGSNIGDHYLGWRDTNICLKGDFGDTFARLYGYLRQFSSLNATRGTTAQANPQLDLPVQDASLLLTVPGRRQDIRRTLLELILEAERSVNIRSWYFLPDPEILNALLSQAERGIDVTVLFSDRTRVPFIDAANRLVAHKLAQSGVCVQRYRGRYMHAKEAWNDKGQILFGSANIDPWALGSNFECDLQLHDSALAQQLQQALYADRDNCVGWNFVRPWQPAFSGFRL